MSVASSVPRSHERAHQSFARFRLYATRCAAAKVSQTGPERRKSSRPSSEGSSWPSTRSVAAGASSAPAPSARSKAIMFRLVSRSACSRVIGRRSNHIRRSREGKAAPGAKRAAVARTATKAHPARKSLSDFITERFDDFPVSQKDVAGYTVAPPDAPASQPAEELARRPNTPSSPVSLFSQALGFDVYPELQQAPIEEYRHKVAEGAPNGNGGGAAAL